MFSKLIYFPNFELKFQIVKMENDVSFKKKELVHTSSSIFFVKASEFQDF